MMIVVTTSHMLNAGARLLGPTGLRVSPLTLGTMTFGDGGWRAGEDQARAIFRRYVEAGGNSIDTADVYGSGRSEELLGALMAETATRDSLVVATKASAPTSPGDPNGAGNGRKHLLASLEGSLRRLRTEYVDLFWLHLWDGATPAAEVMATLAGMVTAGKARAVGLSNVPAWYATTAAALASRYGLEPPAALQLEYSLLERAAETEHIPAAVHTGMSLVPWSPLASGFLAGKYTRDGSTPAGAGRLDPSAGYPDRRDHTERHWATLAAVIDTAQQLGCTPAQVALAWVMSQPVVATIIIGATNVDQLDANLAAAHLEVPAEALDSLSAVSQPALGSPYRLFVGTPPKGTGPGATRSR